MENSYILADAADAMVMTETAADAKAVIAETRVTAVADATDNHR